MNKEKGFANILLIILILLVFGGGVYYFTSQKGQEIVLDESNNEINDIQQNDNKDTKNKEILNLDVPAKITQDIISDTELNLSHSVSYEHNNLCDMRDGKHINQNFVDYDNKIKIYDGTLNKVIKEVFSYSSYDYFDNLGNPNLSEGFFEEMNVLSKKVYVITQGVEGCGADTYFIPSEDRVVVIKRDFIPPFSGNFTEETVQEFENLDGVIKPEEENVIFNNILIQIVNNLSSNK